jgi:flagellum-specific peptidoglycan hydrolase FlgJ
VTKRGVVVTRFEGWLKVKVLLLALVMFPSVCFADYTDDCIEKLAKHRSIVQAHGLFASVYIAQGVLESSWCRSGLAVNHNNYFGRKCSEEPCVKTITNEERNGIMGREVQSFQHYESMVDAVEDYAVKYYRRYDSGHPVFLIKLDTVESFLDGIQNAPRPYSRYATDGKYTAKILSIIKEYNLYRYDIPEE